MCPAHHSVRHGEALLESTGTAVVSPSCVSVWCCVAVNGESGAGRKVLLVQSALLLDDGRPPCSFNCKSLENAPVWALRGTGLGPSRQGSMVQSILESVLLFIFEPVLHCYSIIPYYEYFVCNIVTAAGTSQTSTLANGRHCIG